MTRGAAYALGTQSFFRDVGRELSIWLHTDSLRAKSFALRRGVGNMRHIQTRYLWLQERTSVKHLKLARIDGTDNPADVMTKSLVSPLLNKDCEVGGQRFAMPKR